MGTRTTLGHLLVDYVAHIDVADAPPFSRKFNSGDIQPDLLAVHYREAAHGWEVQTVKVHGRQIKKDGTAGVNRFSESIWTSDLPAAPEWVREAIREYAPKGSLR